MDTPTKSTGRMKAVRPCVVHIRTKTEAEYVFPDIDKDSVHRVISLQVYSATSLTLTNISGACLVVPIRIIDTIAVDGEILWKAPPS